MISPETSIAHIIRDVFGQPINMLLYGAHKDLQKTLIMPEHGIGSFCLHTERYDYGDNDQCQFWEIGTNNPYVSYGQADLVFSANYDPMFEFSRTDFASAQIKALLCRGGMALLVNPGRWSKHLPELLDLRLDLIQEVKSYKIFSEQKVFVYENI